MMQAPSPRWCCPAGTGWPVPADVGHRYGAHTACPGHTPAAGRRHDL